MKTLLLTRHAKTEQLRVQDTKTDFERQLKPRGYRDVGLVVSDMLRRHIRPALLISSTAERAKQTTAIFAKRLAMDEQEIVFEQFLYDGYTTSDLFTYLAQYQHKYESIMIVGHNPEIEEIAASLTGCRDLVFPTTGTMAISYPVNNWSDIQASKGQIEWFITPKILKSASL